MVAETTWYVQFRAVEDEAGHWRTIARVQDRALADEIARLAETSYMQTTSAHHFARVRSRSMLRREGTLTHADWELGMGKDRAYAAALRERAERTLRGASF